MMGVCDFTSGIFKLCGLHGAVASLCWINVSSGNNTIWWLYSGYTLFKSQSAVCKAVIS